LPTEVLSTEGSIDIVLCNEGVYSLHNLLQCPTFDDDVLRKIRGIAYRQDKKVVMTDAEDIVPQARMDEDLPGYAWDLLPYRDKPLDLYRSHFWHAQYDHEKRTPFAALYTSLGCMFKCEFCMINIINRNDSKKVGVASEYSGMRFWSPEFIFKQIEKLFHLGVRTIRISDEMFLLNSRYFVPLCRMLKDSGYGDELNMWAYSRIDTARNAEFLELIRAAGIRWLALGIESGSRSVRLEASKGRFEDVDIKKVISNIESADIDVISNFLFGLPSDTMQSMQATLDLGLEICTTAWNGYPVIALPGSPIYSKARNQGHKLSLPYSYYSFLGYDSTPLPTDSLTSAEILAFRDKAFQTYHTHAPFLEKVKRRFGPKACENLIELTKVKLRRRLLEKDRDH
jgi:anaerobic magnesium-protoporphyrin IX monomethyl ester cyclase